MPDETSLKTADSSTPEPARRASGLPQPDFAEGSFIAPEPANPTTASAGALHAPAGQRADGAQQRIPNWLQQAERFLRVIVRIYLGLLVCCAPWYPPAWDNNPLFLSSAGLLAFVTHGAVRGIVSGLGLLNLWIALRDAMRNSADVGPRR